jgi:3,4-dihydroxy 2-butanone 4-phosphate synthase
VKSTEPLPGTPEERVRAALASLRDGNGVLVIDDSDRENEGDLIFAAETLTERQMALLIRECSGIVCLCLTPERVTQLGLPMMVEHNGSPLKTAFTVSIEAAHGCTTGVSAHDRLCTVRAAIAKNAAPSDLVQPGHLFPLRSRPRGVLERRGHTEATVDLVRLAGFNPAGVLCELMNPDGTMARRDRILEFGREHGFPVVSVDDIAEFLTDPQVRGSRATALTGGLRTVGTVQA